MMSNLISKGTDAEVEAGRKWEIKLTFRRSSKHNIITRTTLALTRPSQNFYKTVVCSRVGEFLETYPARRC